MINSNIVLSVGKEILMNPKVSVIVPVYNVEQYLEKCVNSLINQSLKNIEIILVDDGSTDKSSEICDDFSEKYENVIAVHKENAGQGQARNYGLSLARGEYIGFVDSDDWVDVDYYEKLYALCKKNDLDMCVCERRVFNEKDEIIYQTNIFESDCIQVNDTKTYFFNKFFKYTPSVCNKVYKMNVIKYKRFRDVSEVGTEDTLFNYEVMFDLKKVGECESVYYNSLARENSTARRFESGSILRNYNLLEHMKIIDNNQGVNNDLSLCMFNYFQQRLWNQIKTFASESHMDCIRQEIELEFTRTNYKKISKELIKLKSLDKMGYRLTGIFVVKLQYILKLFGLKNQLIKYICRVFVD